MPRIAGMTLSQDEYEDIHLQEMDVDEARRLIDNVSDDFGTTLDEVQGPVFSGEKKRGYILLVITK